MNKLKLFLLNNAAFIIFIVIFVIFGLLSPRFLAYKSLEIIIVNATFIGVIAVGMTFVLLTGGIDLSVGSTMYFSAAVLGYLVNDLGISIWLGMLVCLLVGLLIGALNALMITRIGMVPFIATLISMILARGAGMFITRSVPMDYPESLTTLDAINVFGVIPMPILLFALVVLAASVFLRDTQTGRQLYAIGNDPEGGRRAGLDTRRLTAMTYMICGTCSALGGIVSIAQLGRVNASFGVGNEFDAIAAAVLGGASLFGGIGTVFPGTLLGAVMIQMIQSGLVFTRIDLYLQPIIMAAIIFLAVLVDSIRSSFIKKLQRRNITRQGDAAAGDENADG
ncbi:MAG: ABC transporter permease [Planctomycetota bacterium]|jgi:ribose/xylose/arabinose/galactoside ABC-type transport system permease subunit|nr:ABC transporter permease [Planctomycetota bacterium]